MSKASDIAAAIKARLQTIKVASGFETDIGLRVYAGRRRIDEGQLPCTVLIERDDDPVDQNRNCDVKLTQKYIAEGHCVCDPDNPNDAGHDMIADLKKAIFTGKFTAPGTATILFVKYRGRNIAPREDGLKIVSASVEFSVDYVEDLSNP